MGDRKPATPAWTESDCRWFEGFMTQLDGLLDLPTPYIHTCLFPGLPVFSLWFSIIHGSKITGTLGMGLLVQVEGVHPNIRYTRNLISSRLLTTHAQTSPSPACGFLGISPLKTKPKQKRTMNLLTMALLSSGIHSRGL